MTINQLRYVIAIAKASSMSEASSKLYISQPALSASIAELEEEVGISIFERNNRGVKLTDDGAEFLVYAKQVVGQYSLMEDRYLAKEHLYDHFSVSAQHFDFGVQAFTDTVKHFGPDAYRFSIRETMTHEVLEHVRDRVSEIGIVSYSKDNRAVLVKLLREYKLDFQPLRVCDAYVYVWDNHEFAGRKEISLEELQDYPFISFEQNNESDFYLSEEALGNYSFSKMIKSSDRATSMELIAQLNGYSIGSGMLAGEDKKLKGLVAIRLKEEDPLTIGYLTRTGSELSEYAKYYIETLNQLSGNK